MWITCWDFPKFYCESDNVCLSLDGNYDKVRENIGPSSEDWNLEPKDKEKFQKHSHTRHKMNKHKNIRADTQTHAWQSTYSTGPDTVLTGQGIQSLSTGYDTRSSYNRTWATFGGGTEEQFCQFYVQEHFATQTEFIPYFPLHLLKAIVTPAFKCLPTHDYFQRKAKTIRLLLNLHFFDATHRTRYSEWKIMVSITITKAHIVKCSK